MRWDDGATLEHARETGLSVQEWQRLLSILGRTPNLTELGIFSVLWSEHCSYKSSRVHLRKLPTHGPRVVQGPGENAGVVALGEGWVTVFKMESHNHPSFIEPYQGAATGVGGILRDVFTMGARPLMLLDSLRFGEPDAPRMRHLVDGVVRGIGDYGNCVGVPTVGGEVDFDPSYNGNILVNAMAVGVAREDGIFYGRASGPGNRVVYMGSKTGRDGIHGATMASDVFDEQATAKRPTVQVGDPFTEKLLIECCLELMSRGLVVGIQDMGAAGLTSSSFEMAARAGCGLQLDLDRIPMREAGMTPYELMLSESQERMLLVCTPENLPSIVNLCKRWGLDAHDVGRVIEEPVVRATFGGQPAFELAIAPLVGDAPRYERPYRKPEPAPPATLPALRGRDWGSDLRHLLASPSMASARRIWEQYDQSVGGATVVGPGADAALLLVPGTRIGLAATTDCNAFACGLDPFNGAAQAVAEAMRNLACVGAEPVGVTDCLNFGSPENVAVMGQLVAAVEGLSEACATLEIPVVSGNVSLYNQTSGQSILPTPTVGMVGVVPEVRHVPRGTWQLGEVLYVLGSLDGELGGSRYLQTILGLEAGPVPPVEYVAERRRARVAADLVRLGLVTATDIADGGLGAALVHLGSPDCGADITLPWDVLVARVLFGEWHGRFLVAVQPACEPALLQAADGVELHRLGTVGGDRLVVRAGRHIILSESMAELCAIPDRQLAWMEGA